MIDGQTAVRGTTNSQFSINAEEGTITLKNGLKFAVQIEDGKTSSSLGAGNEVLLDLVRGILDQLAEKEDFTFDDLGKTSITQSGVVTDQKDKATMQTFNKFTDETYTETYSLISDVAQQFISSLSKPRIASILQTQVEDETGANTTDLSSRVSRRDSDDLAIDVTVESSATENRVGAKARLTFTEIQSLRTTEESPVQPQKTKASNAWDSFLDWLSQSHWLSSHFDFIGSRNLPVPIDDTRAETLLDAAMSKEDLEEDLLDSESRVQFSHIMLPKQTFVEGRSKETSYDHTQIGVEGLERIVSEVALVQGKVKIRKTDTVTEIRAGHRSPKTRKRKKGIGTNSNSKTAMNVMLDAFTHEKNVLVKEYQTIENQYLLLNELSTIPSNSQKLNELSEDLINKWIERGKACDETLLTAPELTGFISALKAFKIDQSSQEKFLTVQEKKQALITLLGEHEGALKKQLTDEIGKRLEKIDMKFGRLQGVFHLLSVHTTGGKAVLERNPNELGKAAEELGGNFQTNKKQIESMIDVIHPDESKIKKDSIPFAEFLNEVFNLDNTELRANFSSHYRWIMSSPKYIEFLNTRYTENNSNISSDSQDKERIITEQKIILGMLADWISTPRLDAEEINEVIVDDRTIISTINAIREEIQDNSDYETELRQINEALETKAVSPDETPKSDKTYQEELSKVYNKKLGKKERKALIEAFGQDLTTAASNAFQKIDSSEFVNLGWSKNATAEVTSPNIKKYIERFNDMGNYFQVLILTVPDGEGERRVATTKEQTNMIEFLIDVQTDAIKRGDVNTAMTIQSAFSGASIARLKKAWSNVKQERIASYTSSSVTLSSEKSYKKLREYLEKNPNALPYIGIFLTDLTMTEEGNKWYIKTIDDAKTVKELFKLNKLNMIAGIMSKTLRRQKSYTIKAPERAIADEISEVNSKAKGDSELYKLSLEAEPRAKTQ